MTPARKGHEFDAIRAAHPILDEVQKHTKLRRSGNQWTGLCPLHNEKSPSFFVSTEKERFKCHGCGASCNLKKGAKHPVDWALENGRLV